MNVQRLPRQHFEQFLKRPKASWQNHKRIRALRHQRFARVHGARHMQLCNALMRHFKVHQHMRNHAHHMPAASQHSVCNSAHQPDFRAAIDQPNAPRRQHFAKLCSKRAIHRTGAIGGCTKDCNAPLRLFYTLLHPPRISQPSNDPLHKEMEPSPAHSR